MPYVWFGQWRCLSLFLSIVDCSLLLPELSILSPDSWNPRLLVAFLLTPIPIVLRAWSAIPSYRQQSSSLTFSECPQVSSVRVWPLQYLEQWGRDHLQPIFSPLSFNCTSSPGSPAASSSVNWKVSLKRRSPSSSLLHLHCSSLQPAHRLMRLSSSFATKCTRFRLQPISIILIKILTWCIVTKAFRRSTKTHSNSRFWSVVFHFCLYWAFAFRVV